MLQTIITEIYLSIGLGFAIRSGWIGGIEMAIAEAQAGIHQQQAIGNRVNTFAYLWDIIVWPAIAASIISKRRASAEIKEQQAQPPAQLELRQPQRRPVPPPPGGNAA